MSGKGLGSGLLAGAALVAVMTGAIVGQQVLRARGSDAVLRDTPVILGSVDPEDLTPPDPDDVSTQADVAAPAALADTTTSASSVTARAAAAPTASPQINYTRVAKPVLTGPRHVGIQAGHWLTSEAPPELWRLITQTGTSWNGVTEVEINLDIAKRIKAILEPKGIVVDVLPTVIPPGYLADAFVSLHGDGDGTGAKSGFKMAYATRRTPYEQDLLLAIKDDYKKTTGLEYDAQGVSRNMLGYYAMSWQRNKYATNPLTPSVILEMGFVSNDGDRELMTDKADVVAGAIASGIVKFLEAHPREKLFGQDLIVPALQPFGPAPTSAPRP